MNETMFHGNDTWTTRCLVTGRRLFVGRLAERGVPPPQSELEFHAARITVSVPLQHRETHEAEAVGKKTVSRDASGQQQGMHHVEYRMAPWLSWLRQHDPIRLLEASPPPLPGWA